MKNSSKSDARLIDYLKTYPLFLLPTHLLSALLHRFMRIEIKAIKNLQLRWFCSNYPVKLDEAKENNFEFYKNFNQFFTRELKDNVRPIDSDEQSLVSPVDGAMSELGAIEQGQLFQAKGHYFSLTELLGGDASLAEQFNDGSFATIYLSPKDYHRIHMPITGKLTQMHYVPGDLFGVNPSSVKAIANLFSRNERVVNIFETAAGPMALIQVGAIFVSSIETTWHGVVTPPRKKSIQSWHYHDDKAIEIEKGVEMGRFNMGSTVILVFAKECIEWHSHLKADDKVQLGQALAKLK